ncbi:MAG: sulfite exporter TauE/SafE family protein [Deltaproteobacteria bacterium]|nr:sulfite exporter TauE/SafE family protein [Deltaproteobacteria bacterium]
MTVGDASLLIAGGIAAGIVNTMAGAGSLLTVPLLVLAGLPGTLANGSNRVGIFIHNVVAAWSFRAEGVSGFRQALPLLIPVALGSSAGALVISQVTDKTFERLFGLVMIVLLLPILWQPRRLAAGAPAEHRSPRVTFAIFLLIGLYGGLFQAGVGLALLLALSFAGNDLVRANSVKVVINAALTGAALPVFVWQGQVVWQPALLLALGLGLGGGIGARLTVRGGERIIRPVLALAVVALAGRMLGLY